MRPAGIACRSSNLTAARVVRICSLPLAAPYAVDRACFRSRRQRSTTLITNSTKSFIGNYSGPSFALTGVYTDSFGHPIAPIFVIGAGSTTVPLVVPATATELFLGIPDANGFEGPSGFYADNS